MAAASESNDASDIFWPGYVDAVTNLAINLLFVIAVMSIVVISTIMQISKMKPDVFKPVENAVSSQPRSMTNDPHNNGSPTTQEPSVTFQQLQQDKAAAEAKLSEQNKQMAKLKQELQSLKKTQLSAKVTPATSQVAGGTADLETPPEVVNAKTQRNAVAQGQNQLLMVGSGGVLVVFEKDVLRLSEAEGQELMLKLKNFVLFEDLRFEIRVNTPKGFSESSRIAYYRVNEIRNVMLQNGVNPQRLSMRVIESDNPSANNARVLVKPNKP
jgi:hypothetical protein